LQLVETKSDAKAAVPAAAPEVEKAPKSRKPAAWQQKAAADAPAAEPLVMVETQK
jgi:ribonuclease E